MKFDVFAMVSEALGVLVPKALTFWKVLECGDLDFVVIRPFDRAIVIEKLLCVFVCGCLIVSFLSGR